MHCTIAYCSENSNLANEMDQDLHLANIRMDHVAANTLENNVSLATQLRDSDNPILLLISDNFLKSTGCMYGALRLVQDEKIKRQVLPIIIDGRYIENDGTERLVPTTFDRVSNVIQYMNYWQDMYLKMRKDKRAINAGEKEAFERQLKIVRSISSEIGEFLRLLRSMACQSYAQFIYNDYEVFFDIIGNKGLHLSFKQKRKETSSSIHEPEQMTIIANPKTDTKNLPVANAPGELDGSLEIEDSKVLTDEPHEELEVEEIEVFLDKVDENNESDLLLDVKQPDLFEELHSESQDENLQEEDIHVETENKEQTIHSEEEHQPIEFEQSIDHLVEQLAEDLEEEMAEKEEPPQATKSHKILESIFEDDEETDQPFEGEQIPVNIKISSKNELDFNYAELQPKELSMVANKLIESGQTENGLKLMKELVNRNPEDPNIRFQYATLLLQYGNRPDKAAAHLEKVIRKNKKHVNAYLLLVDIAESKNDHLLAKSYLEKVVSIEKNRPDIYHKLGIITDFYFKDQKDKAAKYFKKAIKIDPKHADSHYRYAVLLADYFKNKKKAIKHFNQTLKLMPSHPFAYYDLALIYHAQNKKLKAKKCYRKACKINPELKTPENDKAFKSTKSARKLKKRKALKLSGLPKIKLPDTNTPKVVFITGATSGIGRATAEIFAQNGYRLILTGRRMKRLIDIQHSFSEQYESEIQILSFDVRNPKETRAAFKQLGDEWKEVDILINNAGLAKGYSSIHEGDVDHWETMIDTNIKGLLYVTRAITPHMVERKNGHILNICSSAGHEVYPNGNVYCATKHAVDALTKGMRLDLHKHNIRVSQISPGHVEETEFASVRFEDSKKAKVYEDFQPLRAKDVAEAIYFVVTRPDYVNIQDIIMFGTQQASNAFIDRSGRKDRK